MTSPLDAPPAGSLTHPSLVTTSHDLAQSYFDAAGVLLAVLDPQGTILRINPEGCRLLGYEAQELIGQDWIGRCVPENKREAVRAYFTVDGLQETPPEAVAEAPVITRAGDERLVLWRNTLLRDATGAVTGLLVSGMDVTAHRAAESALRLSEDLGRGLIDAPDDGVMLFEPAGTILMANTRAADWFGLSVPDLIGRNILDITSPGLREHRQGLIQQVLETKQHVVFETEQRGTTLEAKLSPVLDDRGQIVRIALFARDITGRKRTEEALRTSEAMVRAVLNAPDESMALIDRDGTIVMVNTVGAQRLGHSVDELVGRDVFSLFSPDMAASRRARAQQAIETGQRVVFEDQRAGMWFENSFAPVFDEHGEVRQIAIFARDITQRKRTEEALRASEAISQAIINASDDGLMLVDTSGVMLMVNQRVADWFGQSADEMIGRSVFEMIAPEFVGDRLGVLRQVFETGQRVVFEVQQRGRILEARLSPVLDEQGQVGQIALDVRDITERKQMEEALRASEARWRALVEAAPDNILTIDRSGKILFINRTALGIPAEEVVGTSSYDYVDPADRAMVQAALDRVFNDGQPATYETAHQLPDGSTLWFSSQVVPLKEGDTITSALAISRDITAMKRTEATLRQLTADLSLRVNELNCLYRISDVVENAGLALDRMLQDTVDLIPRGWSRPGQVCARITLREQVFTSRNFRETLWRRSQPILVRGTPAGHIDVFLTQDAPEISEAERLADHDILLRTIADRLGRAAERIDAELALIASEERHRITSQMVSDFAYALRVEPDGSIVSEWTTDAIERITGYTAQEIEALGHVLAIVHPEDRDRAQQFFQLLHSGLPTIGEYRVITRAGKVRWLMAYGQPVWNAEQGRVERIYGASQDITQRKLAQQALQVSEAHFRGLFDISPDAIALIDLDGKLLMANARMAQVMGYASADELLAAGKTALDFVVPEDRPLVAEALRQDNIEGMISQLELSLLARDGRTIPAEVSARGILAQGEQPVTIMCIVRDISDRRRTEAERYQRAREIAAAEERQRLARELHDAVSQNLFSANLITEMVLRQWEIKPPEWIRQNLATLNQLTRGAQSEMRMLLLELRPDTLADASLETLLEHIVAATSSRTGMQIGLHIEGQQALPPEVRVNLYRIVQEAFSNIVKHSGATQAQVDLRFEARSVKLSLTDNGQGFDVSAARQDRLGLRIMRERAAAINADLSITSSPEGGTQVAVEWRAAKE